MNYLAHYARLVARAKQRATPDGYFERHHIVPRCLGGSDLPDNLVDLTPEEHFVAHQLLAKAYPKNISLLRAAMFMCGSGNTQRANKAYGWLRRRLAEHMRENNPNAGGKSRREYIERNGGPPPRKSKNDMSESGRKRIQANAVERNPCRAVPPWRHPRATLTTKHIWKMAQTYYQWWVSNKLAYYSMARAFGFDAPTMSHQNMYKRFLKGWVPTEDPEWMQFSDNAI